MKYFDYDNKNLAHNLTLTTENYNLDLSKFAPGTKYYWWYTERSKSKKTTKRTVVMIESTIGEVRITWGPYRTLFIEIENTFPEYVNNDIKNEYLCTLTLDDFFFTKEECLENIHKEMKDSEIKEIKEKVQPQRHVWENLLKEWNKTPNKQESTTTQNVKEDNLLL